MRGAMAGMDMPGMEGMEGGHAGHAGHAGNAGHSTAGSGAVETVSWYGPLNWAVHRRIALAAV